MIMILLNLESSAGMNIIFEFILIKLNRLPTLKVRNIPLKLILHLQIFCSCNYFRSYTSLVSYLSLFVFDIFFSVFVVIYF